RVDRHQLDRAPLGVAVRAPVDLVGVDALELGLLRGHGPGADQLLHRGHAAVAGGRGPVAVTAAVAVPTAEDHDGARDQGDDRRDRAVAPQGPGPRRAPVPAPPGPGRAAGPLLGGGHPGAPLPSLSSPPDRDAAAAPAGRRSVCAVTAVAPPGPAPPTG